MSEAAYRLAQAVGDRLREKGLSLGVVESATGGLLSQLITSAPGSSAYYQGSITSYSNQVKVGVVGVSPDTLDRYGAVSAPVAEEMAAGGRRVLASDICLADTGIAGPGGATAEKAVGIFYLGLADKDGTHSRSHHFTGDREQNRLAAATAALDWLTEYLSALE